MNRKKNYNYSPLVIAKLLLGLCCMMVLSGIIMYVVFYGGHYPQGSDTFCHLYRADLILKNILEGNWYPLYDEKWYNGVEIMRYWGPLPLYLIAVIRWLLNGSILEAYVVFLGFLSLLGGIGWLLFGYRYQRIGLSVVIGLLWFFIPENIRVVIYEGNLPRGVINALLPFFFYFFIRVMEDKKVAFIYPLMLCTMLITLSHLGITLMLLATTTIFVTLQSRKNTKKYRSWYALLSCFAGVLLAGMWVVPALIGGAASSASTDQVMKNFFENGFTSLNPLLRLQGDYLSFYFGLSVFLLCVLGILFGTKQVRAGFLTAILLYFCTTKSMYELCLRLPFRQFLWMIRFIPIGLTLAFASFLMWKQLKRWMVVLLGLLLLLDTAPSIYYIYQPDQERILDVKASFDERAQNLLITKAKEITKQRLAIMDLSKYGAFAPYYVAGVDNQVNYTFGAGWEGASTASNIVSLNTAMENGWYYYLFDRALGLGNDTLLIPMDNLKYPVKDVELVLHAANQSGYELVQHNSTSLLFHRETLEQFGVITEYKNLAIGEAAAGIAMIFPSFLEGGKNNLNNYTFEELSQYQTIYLSGFTYEDKVSAEQLLLRLAEHGIRIYIDMNAIPVDKSKKQMELFGVKTQTISFTDSLPRIHYEGYSYQSLDFSHNIGEWNTVYLTGLDTVLGNASVTKKDIPYFGTAKQEHLHFLGLNLIYYVEITKDNEILKLVNEIFAMNQTTLPKRTLVPLRIQTSYDQIEIHSDYDNVSSTIAKKDIFSSHTLYHMEDNMIQVNKGSTILEFHYPHVRKGLIATLIGLLLIGFIHIGWKEKEINSKT